MVKAEVKQDGTWRAVEIEAAKVLRDKPMRCEACHGPVYLMQDYSGARKATFTHRRAFAGCGKMSNGIATRHPAPLD
jgi:hypothetical protein